MVLHSTLGTSYWAKHQSSNFQVEANDVIRKTAVHCLTTRGWLKKLLKLCSRNKHIYSMAQKMVLGFIARF